MNSSNVVCNVGGNYGQNRNYGLFYCYGNSVGNSNSNIGARNLVGVMYVATHM